MVYSIHLSLLKHALDHLIQMSSRLKVLAKGLFDHHLGMTVRVLVPGRQTTGPKVNNNRFKDRWGCRYVNDALGLTTHFFLDGLNLRFKSLERVDFIIAAITIVSVILDPFPNFFVQRSARELFNRIVGQLTKLLIRNRFTAVANKREFGWKEIVHRKIVNSGYEFSRAQVSRSAKNGDDRGLCPSVLTETFQKGMARIL